ncbi:MAG: carbohydrate ABC transporter substrate-binding protein [Clostridiales bacterium]|nr:carbohydrate ABC transporter substrate-binding protein [Clostridiales bacterium]
MRIRKLLSLGLASTMLASIALTGCGDETSSKEEEKGSVYYLNFKPEADEAWQAIAKDYTKETGIEVKVVTAANNTYEQILSNEIEATDAPTLFQINGPVGYANWSDYCYDLKDTDLYSWLLDKSLAIEGEDGGVYGIPYVVEGYGIIYNDAIMSKYFALDDAKAKSMDEVNNFDTLKAVVEDMQARKADLGIDGVFGSTSLKKGEDWRWQTHLANLPVYYEYKEKNVSILKELDFSFGDNYKNIFDLYINNSCTEPTLLGSKTVNDSMSEFALGQVAMIQNGNWGWGGISEVEGNVVKEEDVKFLPIYTGAAGEENQGLCTGTENFFCINKEADQKDIDATIDFVEWVFSSAKGKDAVTNTLGFISPFNTFSDAESPQDPLAKEVLRYMADSTKTSVSWNFTTFPSQKFKDDFGAVLLGYAAGTSTWDDVKTLVVDEWASEWAANDAN